MTIHVALQQARAQLRNSSTPSLDAELLLCAVIGQGRAYLHAHGSEELDNRSLEQFEIFVNKRGQGSPLAYLIHEKEFFGRPFYVDERVLIPRPETEEMLEDALCALRSNTDIVHILDLGTGSGCLAISLALELPERRVYGLEVSPAALEVARKNAKKYRCENLRLISSDLLSSFQFSPDRGNLEDQKDEVSADKVSRHHRDPGEHLDPLNPPAVAILANLPYIGRESNDFVSEETVRHEPELALYGGSDGLELYRRCWQQIKEMQLKVAYLFMEIGFSQAEQMEKEAREAFPEMRYVLKHDLAGLPRTAILESCQEW